MESALDAIEQYVKANLPLQIISTDKVFSLSSADKQTIPFIKVIVEKIDAARVSYQYNQFLDRQNAVVANMGLISDVVAAQYQNLEQLSCLDLDDF